LDIRHLKFRFWYFFWFVLLPLAISWAVVDILDRLDIVDEFEVWYVLLLFALLVVGFYSIRGKLPFWRDLDKNSSYNRTRRAHAAAAMVKKIGKILVRKSAKITERGQREVGSALEGLQAALDSGNHDKIAKAARKLEEKSNRHLAFARKSASREYFESIGLAVLVAIILRLFVVEAFKIPSESMVPTLMVGDHIFVSKYLYGISLPFTNKRLVRFASPAHGEVVVFVKPSVQEQTGVPPAVPMPEFLDDYEMIGKDFIKRIVGLPGDVIEMKEDVLFVNGKEVPRCYLGRRTYLSYNQARDDWEDHTGDLWVERLGDYTYTVVEEVNGPVSSFGPSTVPGDQVFVLGDNRDNSNDSRYWGTVPFDNIKGRAMIIWWSNKPPHGFQWDRFGNLVMSDPDLDAEQVRALEGCDKIPVE
jgi:signal peptidase I